MDVGDAAGCRNILHRQEGTAQQLLGVFDAVGVDVVCQRHADFLFEQRGQVACIQKQLIGKTFQLKSPVSEASMVTRIWRIGSEYELMLRCSTS